jgi:hypothetical protein
LQGLKKLRGCIAASPMVPNFWKEAYRFFFAFFFAAILFSSPMFRILASKLAERVIHLHV